MGDSKYISKDMTIGLHTLTWHHAHVKILSDLVLEFTVH